MVKSVLSPEDDNLGNLEDVLKMFDESTGHKPLDAGVYSAKIISGELKQAKTGTWMYKITWQVIGDKSRRFWQDFFLSAKAVDMSKDRLGLLGITNLRAACPNGICAELELTQKMGDNGIPYNEVKKIGKVWKEKRPEIEQLSMKECEDTPIVEDEFTKSLETAGLESSISESSAART